MSVIEFIGIWCTIAICYGNGTLIQIPHAMFPEEIHVDDIPAEHFNEFTIKYVPKGVDI